MKTLLLLRHARAGAGPPGLDDHERTLNPAGLQDASTTGVALRRAGTIPDRILSSTAVRARTTAERVARGSEYSGEILTLRELYLADHLECLEQLAREGGQCDTLLLVGHNPGMELLVRLLTGRVRPMPPAGLAQIELEIDNWKRIRGPGVRASLVVSVPAHD